jgi:hypothetical protein
MSEIKKMLIEAIENEIEKANGERYDHVTSAIIFNWNTAQIKAYERCLELIDAYGDEITKQ